MGVKELIFGWYQGGIRDVLGRYQPWVANCCNRSTPSENNEETNTTIEIQIRITIKINKWIDAKFIIEDLNVEIKKHLSILKVEEPAKRQSGVMLKTVDELVDKLKNEAKVI